jgi:hypothetical protein
MAVSFSYPDEIYNFTVSTAAIYRATSGGTVFSSNLVSLTNFDLFNDSSIVNDAIYFTIGNNGPIPFGLRFNVGTPLMATSIELVWEYYKYTDYLTNTKAWEPIEDLLDNTNSFQTTGVNSVKFPAQWQPASGSINGSSAACMWVRVRIKSVTGLTEGGANTTHKVTYGNAILSVTASNYTTDTLTFEDIYNWMRTNQPHINIQKLDDGKTYDFKKFGAKVFAKLISQKEKVLLGQNSLDNNSVAGWRLTRFYVGTRLGNRSVNGSDLLVFGTNNSGMLAFDSPGGELYGCNVLAGGVGKNMAKYPGYCNLYGTFVDCNFEIAPYFSVSTVEFTNVKINGSFVIFTAMPNTIFNNFTYIANGGYMFYIPPLNSHTIIKGLDWAFAPATFYKIFYFYMRFGRFSAKIELLNPVKPLPVVTTNLTVFDIGMNNPVPFSKVLYYNAAANTYTDYTLEASSVTTSDIPLWGEVGDIIYLALDDYSYNGIDFNSSITSNDYEYAFEYYDTTNNWVSAEPELIDGTNNLNNSGRIVVVNYDDRIVYALRIPKLISINGINNYWTRIRIIKKGTGTPTANHIKRIYTRGFGPWSIFESFSIDLKLIDSIGNGIGNANVILKDSSDNIIWAVTTNISGNIEPQKVITREGHCDISELNYVKDTKFTDFKLIISKENYQTYSISINEVTEKISQTITLTPNPAPVQFSIRRLLSRIFQSGKPVSSSELITEGTIEHEAALDDEAEIVNGARATYRPSSGDILMEQETVPGVWEEAEIISEGVELVRGSASIIEDPDPIYIDQSIIAKIHNSQSIKALVDDNENIKATIKSNQRLHATITDPEHITATVRTSQNIKATIT